MSDWLDNLGNWRRGSEPPIRVALALSVLLHAAALWWALPRLHLPSLEQPKQGDTAGSLLVRIAPPPADASLRQTSGPSRALTAHESAPLRARALPPVIAVEAPAPQAQPTPHPSPTASATARPDPPGDFSSYVEARRRARGDVASADSPPALPWNKPSESAAPETDADRIGRIVAGNLGTQRRMTFGYDPSRGGGMFQITRLSENAAEFIFLGWDKEIQRNTKQYIEVRKGEAADIRIAVVRRMVSIIREHEAGDFLWESTSLGRYITLSARPKDNAELERFLIREFFREARSSG